MYALSFRRPIADSRAYISNPFGNYYEIREGIWNYHSSIDVVFQEGSIAHAPIQSVAWGVVTYAERVTAPGYTVFGNLIVVKSVTPDGETVYCRYAHVENLQVKAGDVVHPGQHLADVGNAYGAYAYHLDFAISRTTVLAMTPWDWPGTDLARVYEDYVDPCSFIREHPMGQDFTALNLAAQNVLAAAEDLQTVVDTYEEPTPPPVGTTMYCTTTKLNVRTAPGVADNVVGWLAKYDAVQVVDAGNGWQRIVGGQVRTSSGVFDVTTVAQTLYASGSYLSTTRPT